MGRGGTIAAAVVLAGALAAPLAGCMSAYEGDTYLVDAAGLPDVRARRLDCLDVRVALVKDSAAPDGWPIVGIELGNRCRAPVDVDLRHVRVTAQRGPGTEVPFRPYDPRAELDAAVLDGRARAREVIAYIPPAGIEPDAASICVDVSGITRAPPATPVCFEGGT